MKTKIGLDHELTGNTALELSKVLADEFILYTKTRNAHWNTEGPDFYSAHKFFEEQYELLDEVMDDVAERIRSIGHFAPATLKVYLKLTALSEGSQEGNSSSEFIKELLIDHESIIVRLRESITRFMDIYKDAGSSDFVTGLMAKHEKMAWMLRAHLK